MSATQVRRYRPADEPAVRRISCDTALYGRPIDPLFQDRDLVADALVGYYTRYEPETTYVAQAQEQVVGYLTGCLETARFDRIFAREVLPELLRRVAARGHWLKPSFWRLALAGGRSARRWSRREREIVPAYPAHCHINLDREFRQSGTGRKLLQAFLADLRLHRVPGVHILTATEGGKAFFQKTEFTLLGHYPAPRLPGISAREIWIMGLRL